MGRLENRDVKPAEELELYGTPRIILCHADWWKRQQALSADIIPRNEQDKNSFKAQSFVCTGVRAVHANGHASGTHDTCIYGPFEFLVA